jgi:FPC/CPF motif-containing protein YcgG
VLICPALSKERTVEEYHGLFWSFLKRLRQLDPKPWPEVILQDTSDSKWCISFDGVEAFFAVLTPAHKQRLSRYSENFVMVY